MKKIIFTLCLLSISFSVFAERVEVDMSHSTTMQTKPRSVVQKPSVSINDQTFDLSVTFLTTENFTLYVYDQRGAIIFQEMLISDGARHYYQLPTLECGEYTVSIESEKCSFEGTFSL